MEIQNIQAFVSVSESGSFSRSAEQLFLTQPAISKRIHALEHELGTRLFDRIGKQVQLTEAGKALLPHCYRILKEIEQSKRVVTDLSGSVSGILRLATSHHIGLHRLPPVLKRYTQQYPDVELDMHFMDSEQACEAVLRGQLELAIATLPEQADASLTCKVIWEDPLSFIVAADHALAGASQLNLPELLTHPAILPSPNTYTRALLEQTLGEYARQLRISMETNYLETIKMLVATGLGWSVLPTTMIDDEVVELKIHGYRMQRHLGTVVHRDRTLSNAAMKLLEILDDS